MAQAYVPLRQFLYTASSALNLVEMLRLHWVVLILGRLASTASITSTFRSHEAYYASLVPTAFSSRVSGTCRHDSLFYFESLLNQTSWAWKSKSLVFISTSKPSIGSCWLSKGKSLNACWPMNLMPRSLTIDSHQMVHLTTPILWLPQWTGVLYQLRSGSSNSYICPIFPTINLLF